MSENKKVIHVKDLVIKADHVHVEPDRRSPRYDPFFGRPIYDQNEHPYGNKYQEEEEVKEEEHEYEEEDRERRDPFSWI